MRRHDEDVLEWAVDGAIAVHHERVQVAPEGAPGVVTGLDTWQLEVASLGSDSNESQAFEPRVIPGGYKQAK